MSDPSKVKVFPSTSAGYEEVLKEINSNNPAGVLNNFVSNLDKTQVTPGKRSFLKAGGRTLDVTGMGNQEVLALLAKEKILIPPKKPTPKSSIPKDTLAPGFKKRRHKILAKIKARKKK